MMPTKKVETLYNRLIKYLNSIKMWPDKDMNEYETKCAIETLDELCERLMNGEKLK